MRTPLTVAVAQPDCTPGEVGPNAASHAAAIADATARLVVFPELSLTGYDLDGTVLVRCNDRPGSLARAVLHDGSPPPHHRPT